MNITKSEHLKTENLTNNKNQIKMEKLTKSELWKIANRLILEGGWYNSVDIEVEISGSERVPDEVCDKAQLDAENLLERATAVQVETAVTEVFEGGFDDTANAVCNFIHAIVRDAESQGDYETISVVPIISQSFLDKLVAV